MSRSNECFYIDKDGKRQDRAIHAEMLTPEAEERAFRLLLPTLRSRGWTDSEIETLYGRKIT
jgi:hypothetical protein